MYVYLKFIGEFSKWLKQAQYTKVFSTFNSTDEFGVFLLCCSL